MSKEKKSTVYLRSTERSLPIALLRARETVMEPVREMLLQSQISEQKWRVLRVVDESGPIEQSTIAKTSCLLLPSLTRIVQAMETDGLLTRAVDSKDRRKSIISVTQKGRNLIQEHVAQSNRIFATIEEQLGKTKIGELLDLLEELRQVRI